MEMKIHSKPVLLLVTVVALALSTACAGGGSPPLAPTTAPTATAEPRASLEGRFGYGDMAAFFDAVAPMVREFFEDEYPGMPAPRQVLFVARGQAGRSGCYGSDGRPAAFDSSSYEYCPASASIYVGQDLLWAFYRLGDAAPVIGLAHEWGHHLQSMRRLPAPRSNAQSVVYENQADCVSGAWARFADRKGWLEADDDLVDVGSLLQAIGTREGAGGDHGTAAERKRAFDLGFARGIAGCNEYFPATPIA